MRNLTKILSADVRSRGVRRGVITIMLGAAVLAVVDHVRGLHNRVTAPVFKWFAGSVPRSQVVVWLLVGFLGGLLVAWAGWGRRPVPAIAAAPEAPTDEEPGAVPMDFSPNEQQRVILKGLLRSYPAGADLETVHGRLRLLSPFDTPAHSERQLEGLLNAAILANARPAGQPRYYQLTTPGRDFAIALPDKDGRDAEGAQPASRPARRPGPSGSPMMVADDPGEPPPRDSLENYTPPDPATTAEVGTKLDLAKAFVDIDDRKQAIKALDEVLAAGTIEQKLKAKEFKKRLP